jgi:hypothetical protein
MAGQVIAERVEIVLGGAPGIGRLWMMTEA